MSPFQAHGYWYKMGEVFCLRFSGHTELVEIPGTLRAFLEPVAAIYPSIHLLLDISGLIVVSERWDGHLKLGHELHHLAISQVCIVDCDRRSYQHRLLRIMLYSLFNLAEVDLRFFNSVEEAIEQCA